MAIVFSAIAVVAAGSMQSGCSTPRRRALDYNRQAAAAYDRDDPNHAWQLLALAIREDPTLAEVWYNQGVIALDLFREALLRAPDDVRIRTRLGMALIAEGDLLAAVDEFRAALDADPTFAAAWFGLGLAYERLDEPAAAAVCYRKGLAHESDAAAFWDRLLVLQPTS
jgi:Tfp pilus assembly protein PilF